MPLTSERAAIFRITHVANFEWDVVHGLQCRNSDEVNPDFRNIGNLDLIEKRKQRPVPIAPGGTLSDYVPFYFTSRSPMLYNIRTGYRDVPKVSMDEVVIYAANLRKLAAKGTKFVFTDRHAKLEPAKFSSDLTELDGLDWQILDASDFRHDPADPGKKDRYQAEALIYRNLQFSEVAAVLCCSAGASRRIEDVLTSYSQTVPVIVQPGYFF